MYIHSIPKVFRRLWNKYAIFEYKESHEVVLSFDDGPHSIITSWVLDILKEYNRKAIFFCVGDNVRKYPDVYKRILDEGHRVGNHSYNHIKIKDYSNEKYIENVKKASELIDFKLFRPPYGKMNKSLAKLISKDYQIVLWTVLSGDFDVNINKKKCLSKTIKYTKPGAIIVFHDNIKSFDTLKYVLPRYLEYLKEKNL